MIPRFKPFLDWREIFAAVSIPRKDDIDRFEKAFAKLMGQKHAIAFPYGRTGLILLLEAMELKGKEIICPAYTCVVVAHAIVYSGNIPVFVDSQESDFNMNLDLVPPLINDNTGAIIATSLFGYPVDLDKLDAIRKSFPHVQIIQDCAHSFAAEWNGRPVQQEGDAAIFGMNISKLITSIFGGMVTTDKDWLATRLRQLRTQRLKKPTFIKSLRRFIYLILVYIAFWEPIYGLINRLERIKVLDRFSKYYDESKIDMPKDYLVSMTNVESRVGTTQIKKYTTIINKHRIAAAYFDEKLLRNEEIKRPIIVEGATYSHYVVRCRTQSQSLYQALCNGVQLGQLIEYVVPEMKAYSCRIKRGQCFPIAHSFPKTTINLPVWTEKEKKINRIINF